MQPSLMAAAAAAVLDALSAGRVSCLVDTTAGAASELRGKVSRAGGMLEPGAAQRRGSPQHACSARS